MNTKIDEVMSAYANILSNLPEKTIPDALWHSTVNFPDTTTDLDVGQISLQTNAFLSTAMDKKDQDVVKEKLTPVEIVDMIEVAHPEPVYIADAMADGGLVENQNELHQKLVEMINKYPSGSIGHKYASLVEDILVVAEQLDTAGNTKAARELDSLAADISDILKKNSNVVKHAYIQFAIGAALLAAVGVGLFSVINGMQENLQKDAQDLADNISGWIGDPEYASVRTAANQALSDTRNLISVARELMAGVTDLSKNRSPELAKSIDGLHAEADRLIKDINSSLGSVISVAGTGKTGLDFSITSGKLNDLNTSYEKIIAVISGGDGQVPQSDQFDSPEMESATITDREDEISETTVRQPLNKDTTVKTLIFISRAYKPIDVARVGKDGGISEEWYKGIKEMLVDLRDRLQKAVAVQDPEAAIGTAADLNILNFVRMNNDGDYSLLVDADGFNRIFNLVETTEKMADEARAAKHPIHPTLLQ